MMSLSSLPMRLSRLIFVLTLAFAAGTAAHAELKSADLPHVHVELVVLPQGMNRSESADAGLYFKLDPGWHVYWKNAGDAGEPPHIRWTLPDGISATPLQFPAPQRLPLGPLMDFGYEGEVLFPLTLHVAPTTLPGIAVLHAKVDWLVCSDRCIPGKTELETNLAVYDQPGKTIFHDAETTLYKRLIGRLPKPLPAGFKTGFQPAKEGFRLTVETGRRESAAAFFPADRDILDNPAPQKLTPTAKGFFLDLKKDAQLTAAPAQLHGVLELPGGRSFEIVALPGVPTTQPAAGTVQNQGKDTSEAKARDSLAGSSAAAKTPAYLGSTGQAATPFSSPGANGQPTVSTYSAAPQQSNPSAIPATNSFSLVALLRASGLAFLGGLILNLMPCVFPVLFLKGLALVNSGNKERHTLRIHGLVYTTGILASFWLLVGVLLGLRAAGSVLGWGFQFQSPVFLALMAGLLFFLGLSLAGQFEVGLTMTSAGGSLAEKKGYTGSFFTGVLAVVVATPCTAPLMGPAIGYALAQSAAVSFAVFTALALGLAAPYLALTLQPAWTRVLPRPGVWMEVLRQAISVPIFATVIWLAWVLAQAYGAATLAALLGSFLLLAIAGWFLGRYPAKRWATTVGAVILLCVVGLAFYGQKLVEQPTEKTANAAVGVWQPWSPEAVSRAQAAGHPVFVDFTASWCLSCQVNEKVALNQPEVKAAFAEKKVVLLKADWTRHDESITQALAGFGRSGVPTYILYLPEVKSPQILPEVLTPGIVMEALGNS